MLARSAGAFALLAGAVTLVGWFAGIPRLTDWNGQGISMFANPAMCACLTGLALLILAGKTPARERTAVILRLLGGVIAGAGILTLFEHVTGLNLGIDTLLVHENWGQGAASAPMRMGPPATTSFTLMGIGILLATSRRSWSRSVASALGATCLGIASLSIIGYAYGAKPLFSAHLTGIALQTGIVLAALGAGLVFVVPDRGMAAMLARPDAGGELVRRLVPPLIALPLVLGALRLAGERAGLYEMAFGTAARTWIEIALFLGLLFWTARSLSRIDTRRRETENRFRLAAGTARFGVHDYDVAADRGVWTEELYAIAGLPPDALVTMETCLSIVHPEDRAQVATAMHAALDPRGSGELAEEYRIIRPDSGEIRWVFNRSRAIFERAAVGDRVVRIAGIVADITDRKEAEIARDRLLESERLARAEAEEASRVKDEFLSTLSHELRTPLNAILGWSQLVAMHPSDEHVNQAIPAIIRNARAQADLISDLLDMSRITSGKLRLSVEPVNLGDVISAAMETIRPAAEATGIRLESRLEPCPEVIWGDPGRLRQVVWNLLANAVKFTPSGGCVRVSLTRKDLGVEILVSDTGVGLPTDFLPHLFERFRQRDASATRQHGGMGLGLAIVKHLVDLHGGTVSASSAGEGQGTTFSVWLPFATVRQISETPHVPVGQREDDTELHGVKILAVDDQADTLRLFERVLRERHAYVVTAASAAEALRVLRAEPIDIVLCDLGMPVQDGLSFIRQARAEGHTTPALAVTAFARTEDRDRALSAGYQGHITKPVDIATLVAAIAGFVPTRT